MAPVPTSPLAINTPKIAVKSSGAELPALISVAPATSSLKPKRCANSSSEGIKYRSHTSANE